MQDCFIEVITNQARFRDGALRVAPCHSHQHGCTLCPANLCKGLVRLLPQPALAVLRVNPCLPADDQAVSSITSLQVLHVVTAFPDVQ